MAQKRLHDEIPSFEDPMDLVNAVILTLNAPPERTNVSIEYLNEKNATTEVQAYAKIAGCDWTYYVKTLLLTIGRNTDVALNPPPPAVHIDLGLAKVVSRQHAIITYNIDLRCWELKVLGRNGARMDGVKVPIGPQHAAPLHLGAILDVGGTQMMFILPDAPPSVLQKMVAESMARYSPEKNKIPRIAHAPVPSQGHGSYLGNFQMFDKGLLAPSPSAVSAVSLQNNLDQDLSKEDSKDIKPPYLYATMITQAILSNPDGVMSLSEIYAWILCHYAYYKYLKTGWQNLIRHNLSLNKAFEKVPRRPNEPGKGMKWQISELYRAEFMKKIQNGTLLKLRRGLSVLRTLQIHLATHLGLPEQKPYAKYEQSAMDLAYDKNVGYAISPVMMQPYMAAQVPPNMTHNGHTAPYTNPAYRQRMIYQGSPPGPEASGGHNGPTTSQNTGHYLPQSHQPQHQPQHHLQHQENQNQSQNSSNQSQNNAKQSHFHNRTHNRQILSDSQIDMMRKEPGLMYLSQPIDSSNYPLPVLPYKTAGLQAGSDYEHTADAQNHTSFNTSHLPNTSESVQNLTAPTTSNTTELGLAFTSPKRIAPLEAFTPERGLKTVSKNANQLSPAFWNFVQFSTPNAQSPGRKLSEEVQTSPTLTRRTAKIEDA